MPASDGGDDGVGIGGPGEGLGFGVVLAHEAVDGGLEVDDGVEDAALEPSPGELGEEASDSIELGAGGRCEVEGPARMPVEPGPELRSLVCCVIFGDVVDAFVRRAGG